MFCLGFGVERHPDRGGSVFKMSRRGAVEFNDLIQRQNGTGREQAYLRLSAYLIMNVW